MEQLDTADNSRKKLKGEFQEANEKIISLEEQLYESKSMQNELLEQLRDLEDRFEETVNSLEEKLEESEKKLEESEKRLLTIDDLEAELAYLRKLQNTIYIPRKGDRTDAKLSEYVNNRPENDQLKIMFLRESEGVYQFGQKRVYVKVEKGG